MTPGLARIRQNSSTIVPAFAFTNATAPGPIVNTGYESPVKPEDTCMPHLVYDDLDRPAAAPAFARQVVQAILERKYADYCPADYVARVVSSFRDDPVRLREFRYVKPAAVIAVVESRSAEQIALIVNDRHDIHHVNERGYVESPVRVKSILKAIEPSGLFTHHHASAVSRQAPLRGSRCGFRGVSQTRLRRGARENPFTPISFPSATRPVLPRSRRCFPAITASTRSRPSTPTPIRRRAAAWTAP
jgi:hypothetical protein